MGLLTTTQMFTGVKNWVLEENASIKALIPAQASSQNQLADKAFVNSSIATATATFRGTYNLVSDLSLTTSATQSQIASALASKMTALSITPDANDYAFVQVPAADDTPTVIARVDRYKYNGSAWAYEYSLNNSGFTAEQWAAINSGATLELIGKLSALPTNAQLTELLNGKVSLVDNGAYDVSANNGGITFASLSALLSSQDLSTLIPTAVRKGGMSIKYVSSSDNKYVQCRCMADEFTTDTTQWAIDDEGVYVDNPEFVYVKTDSEGKILFGIKVDGEPYFGVGCPQQVKEYVEEKISSLSLDEYEDIVSFLSDYLGGDTTLKSLIDSKLDAEGLDSNALGTMQAIDNPEFLEVTTDIENKILEGIKEDGTKVIGADLEVGGDIKNTALQAQIGQKLGRDEAGDYIQEYIDSLYAAKEIDIELENGVFTGSGNDASSTKYIRTPKIPCSGNELIIAIASESLDIQCNFERDNSKRQNLQYKINGGISIKNPNGFIRFGYTRRDGSDFNINNITNAERNSIHVYKIVATADNYDVILAAYDTNNTTKANIICTDSNAQFILNACLSCIGDIKILLLPGTYNLYKVLYTHYNEKCALKTQDAFLSSTNIVGLEGVLRNTTSIRMMQECFEEYSNNSEGYLLNVPCRNQDGINILPYSYTYITLKNLMIYGYDYTKPIACVDFTFANEAIVENLTIRSDLKEGGTGLHDYSTTPNDGCIGVRVGHGSNNGVGNKIKSTRIFFCGKGVSCLGEHFVFEDVLAHHCKYGFAFGDKQTLGGGFEHPNVMVGCSIEGCKQLMYLTKGGIVEEGEFVHGAAGENMEWSTLVCIGLSTEAIWSIPLDERIEGESTWTYTLPILEVLKGAYRGRMELDFYEIPFTNGSGRLFNWTYYYNGHTMRGHGNTETERL